MSGAPTGTGSGTTERGAGAADAERAEAERADAADIEAATAGTVSAEVPRRRLDPDALAALEEQHEFLRRSLVDLDHEYAAGDLDEDDHRTLAADYRDRAGRVAAAIEEGKARFVDARRHRSPRRLALALAALAAFAAIAGLVVAQAAGRRDPGEAASGADPRSATRQALAECLDLGAAQQVLEALRCYDGILADQPDNAEALAYRGWFLVLAGLPGEGLPYLDRAVETDPGYADARAFRAVVLNGFCRPSDAVEDLDVLETLDPPPGMRELTAGVRADAEGQLAGTGPVCAPPTAG